MVELGLGNGVLAYHLDVLEREGFIKSRREGMYKHFHPTGTTIGQRLSGTYYEYFGDTKNKEVAQLSKLQRSILEVIQKEDGISQKQLAQRLGKSKQLVSYHVRKLDRAGLVRKEHAGNGHTKLYVME